MAKAERKLRVVADNRKARFNYFIDETLEAGVALTGTEVKSLRQGKATIGESYADTRGGEIWLINSNIPEYQQANRFNHAPKRPRKLLLHRRQINKLIGAVEREGMTLVPLKLYFNEQGPRQDRARSGARQETLRQARDREEALLGARARPPVAAEGVERMVPVKLDHCVIHVTEWERSNAFYTKVLGAELIERPVGYAYRFGDRQLNVHGPGVTPAEVARLPVAPGNSDLCFEWLGPIADAIAHLKRCSVAIDAGPMQRFGARGSGTSVYFRDPDGSLMEFITYA